MTEKELRPCGEWPSPITSALIVSDAVRLAGVAVDGDALYWLEGRPQEGGRYVLVRLHPGGERRDVTPAGFNVRTRAHEYGGGAFLVADGRIWFCNFDDQRIYAQPPAGPPSPITAEGPYRYADLLLDAARDRLICVREHHRPDAAEPVNELVAIDLQTGHTIALAAGNDFYSSPALSPNGKRLAWLSWAHPDMPWDGTELMLAEFDSAGGTCGVRKVCGGRSESVFQPAWSPDGTLYFVTDPDGWWNLHRLEGDRITCVHRREAEFARPQWQFGMRTYGFCGADALLSVCHQGGMWQVLRIDTASGAVQEIEAPCTAIEDLAVGVHDTLMIGASPAQVESVMRVDVAAERFETVHQSVTLDVPAEYLSIPRARRWQSAGAATAHGFFYPPTSARCRRREGEKPPLIVIGHGGPTSSTTTGLKLALQFWTSRGFAVLDVNYRGSTGYGRPYREALKGEWGVADVEDCVHGARALVAAGKVDENRIAIRGSSAGGYTTLAALTFHEQFNAGASYYGISELEALAKETHKFESRYLDQLIGPYPAERARYYERSPINFIDRLACPVIFFQGLEDKVVPPNQAEMMVEALRSKGLPVAYLAFDGEQHGFRKAETIKRALEAELYFYARVFGFTPADTIEPVEIFNLDI